VSGYDLDCWSSIVDTDSDFVLFSLPLSDHQVSFPFNEVLGVLSVVKWPEREAFPSHSAIRKSVRPHVSSQNHLTNVSSLLNCFTSLYHLDRLCNGHMDGLVGRSRGRFSMLLTEICLEGLRFDSVGHTHTKVTYSVEQSPSCEADSHSDCQEVFYDQGLLAPRSNSSLQNQPLSAARDCLFSVFTATLHIWRPSPPSATRRRPMTRDHFTWNTQRCICFVCNIFLSSITTLRNADVISDRLS
jgi:hypothetical protein